MNQIAFDTLEYSKILQNAGVPQAQADAFAAAQKIALAQVVDNAELATKKDLLELESKLNDKINDSHNSLVKWFIGTTLTMLAVMIAGMGIIIALMPR